MAEYSYEEFVKAMRDVLHDGEDDPSELDETAANLEVNSRSLYVKLSKSDDYRRLEDAKEALRELVSSSRATTAAPLDMAALLPMFKREHYYDSSDKSVLQQSDDKAQLLIRTPLAENSSVMVGLAVKMTKQDPSQGITQYAMISPAKLKQASLEGDPYQHAVSNLSRKWTPTLEQLTEVGPCNSSEHALQWAISSITAQHRYSKLLCSNFRAEDCTLLLLPAMVRALCRVLKCAPAQLVVTPFHQNRFYAGACFDPMAMCMLGDFTSTQATASDPVTILSSVPLTVLEVPNDDSKAVTWQNYEYHGTPFGMLSYDGTPCFTVPRSEEEADKMSAGMRTGVAPPLVKVQFTDQCFCCRAAGDVELKACAKCRVAVYCSVECQKKDWLQHKVMCKEYCAKGQKGNGPAAPTQGEEILTPYALPLY